MLIYGKANFRCIPWTVLGGAGISGCLSKVRWSTYGSSSTCMSSGAPCVLALALPLFSFSLNAVMVIADQTAGLWYTAKN